jgi:hypothetical protein
MDCSALIPNVESVSIMEFRPRDSGFGLPTFFAMLDVPLRGFVRAVARAFT